MTPAASIPSTRATSAATELKSCGRRRVARDEHGDAQQRGLLFDDLDVLDTHAEQSVIPRGRATSPRVRRVGAAHEAAFEQIARGLGLVCTGSGYSL